MRDGAIADVSMDWPHIGEMLAAGRAVFTELKNLVGRYKTNGGMGAFYRSTNGTRRSSAAAGWAFLKHSRSRAPDDRELLYLLGFVDKGYPLQG